MAVVLVLIMVYCVFAYAVSKSSQSIASDWTPHVTPVSVTVQKADPVSKPTIFSVNMRHAKCRSKAVFKVSRICRQDKLICEKCGLICFLEPGEEKVVVQVAIDGKKRKIRNYITVSQQRNARRQKWAS